MLRLTMRRWLSLLAVAIAVGVAAPVYLGPSTDVLAQPGCLERVWDVRRVVDGIPEYGWVFLNRCLGDAPPPPPPRPNTCHHQVHGEFLCTDPGGRGTWTNMQGGCYYKLMEPQPPPEDSRWGSMDPSESSFYLFSCPLATQSANLYQLLEIPLAQAPPSGPSLVDLRDEAIDQLGLQDPAIGIAPDPDGVGLVGVPVWLWVDNPDNGWGPVGEQCVPGPIEVCAQAEVIDIRWDMGNGWVEQCPDAGTPYRAEYGAREPNCGYTYTEPSSTQPDGRYTITATTWWRVEWWVAPRGSGADEDLVLPPRSSSVSIQINELQVVTS